MTDQKVWLITGAGRGMGVDMAKAAIDHAYQAKYARYARSYVEPMVSPDATAATLRLVPC